MLQMPSDIHDDKGSHRDHPSGGCTTGRFSWILALLIAITYPHVLFGWQAFAYRDFSLYSYPVTLFLRESFLRGEIPLWNPLNYCGVPFLAQWSTMVFYPLSFLFAILPLPWALSVFSLLHLFAGGLGAFLLARRWLGSDWCAAFTGVAFTFNGLAISFLMWPHYTVVWGLLPWVLLLLERARVEGGRWICAAAVAGALQMLGGMPEFILLTWCMAGVLAVIDFRRMGGYVGAAIGRLAAVALLVAGLVAFQLLPFMDFLMHSHRGTGIGSDAWAMPTTGWANFLVPLFNCYRWHAGVYVQLDQWWVSSYYSGIVVFALAVAAALCVRDRRVFALSGIAVTGMILALGDAGYVYALLRRVFPFLEFMRYPVKYVFLCAVAFPLLAGFGLRAVLSRDAKCRSTLGIVTLVFSVLTAGILVFGYHHPLLFEEWRDTYLSGMTRLLFLAGGVLLLFRMGDGSRRFGFPLACLVLLVWLWLDFKTHTVDQNPAIPAAMYEADVSPLEENPSLPRLGQGRVMMSRQARRTLYRTSRIMSNTENFVVKRLGAFANANIMDGIPKLDGFFSLYLADTKSVVDGVCYARSGPPDSLADFLGVSHITAPGTLFTWQPRTNAMPPVYAGQQPEFVPEPEILSRLREPGLDLRKTVLLPETARDSLRWEEHGPGEIEMRRFGAQAVEFTVVASNPVIVTVAQSYYHPWQARVGGTVTPLLKANGAFQALEVPEGRHVVSLRYVDRAFRRGAVITAFALLVLGAQWVRAGRRRIIFRP